MSLISGLQKFALIPSVVVGNLVTKGLEKVTKKKYGRTTTSQLQATTGGKVLSSTILATGGALAVASGAVGAVARGVGSSAIRAPIPTAVGTLVGVPLVVGALTSGNPEQNIGKVVTGSFDAGSQIIDAVKENPGVTGLIGGITGAVGAYEIFKNLPGLPDSVPSIDSLPADAKSGLAGAGEQNEPLNPFPAVGSESPSSTLVQPLPADTQAQGSKGTSKKRRKTRSKPSNFNVSQRVDVRVNAGNKRYLNKLVVAR